MNKLKLVKLCIFQPIHINVTLPTNGRTNRRTDSYRDARMHLKMVMGCLKLPSNFKHPLLKKHELLKFLSLLLLLYSLFHNIWYFMMFPSFLPRGNLRRKTVQSKRNYQLKFSTVPHFYKSSDKRCRLF